ncbi:MAG: hypothetical protein Q9169_006067 [Polycauliona sp. 2 TL-2023]
MASYARADLISKVLLDLKCPDGELDDHTCYICWEDTLTKDGRERPVELKCGHIFGMTCILADAIEAFRRHSAPRCPHCRELIVQGLTIDDLPVEDDEDLADWIHELASWVPGDSVTLSTNDNWCIRHAEKLWTNICDSMLEYMENFEYFGSRSLGGEIEYFLYTLMPAIEGFLSYGTVYNFHPAFRSPGFTVDKLIETQFQLPYRWLTRFLRKCKVDDVSWRVSSAFQGEKSRIDEFRRRIEWTRGLLSERVEIARQARAISGRGASELTNSDTE